MTPTASPKPEQPDTRAIIHIDMDAFYASVEQHDHPELRHKPVIVGGTGQRGVVAAASYEVREFGVHSAMPMTQARRRCPHAVILPVRMSRYREVSSQVFSIFHEVTPLVEGLSLDEAFLDVSASLTLFGSIETIGANLRRAIHQGTGLHASVGMAHNKYLAKLASDAAKPRGFVHVPVDRVRAFLDPMPVNRIWGLGKRTLPRIRSLGILTIGQLRKADPVLLATILGNRAAHFMALARGEDSREVIGSRVDKSLSREMTFEVNISDPRQLFSVLLRQVESVTARLRAHGKVARTIQVKIRDPGFRTVTRRHSLQAPTRSTQVVYTHARSLLQQWLELHRNTPVRLLGIGVSGLEDAENAGMTGDSVKQTVLDSTLDEIARRFGTGAATRALTIKPDQKPGSD